MNPLLQHLHSYPFVRLNALLSDVKGPDDLLPISLAVGEPQAQPPDFVKQALIDNLDRINAYPATLGLRPLREAITEWLSQRYAISLELLDPDAVVLPVQGTREGLFAIAQAVVDSEKRYDSKGLALERFENAKEGGPLVFMPSPFYQIYEGAAILAGAQPWYLPCDESSGFAINLDDVEEQIWQRCQLFYICNPSNPTGALFTDKQYKKLLLLADQYDFVVVSDECYSEIYSDESAPCPGLLGVCATVGRNDFSRCLVFNSLSKRSNLAGLRSGFVAGDATLIKAFLSYRTYHGSAMPLHHQAASIAAWRDERHVLANRAAYREKIQAVSAVLGAVMDVSVPAGGFCLWVKTTAEDTVFARELYRLQHVTVLPGSYLAREVAGVNPGANYVRMALVQPLEQCLEAAHRIVAFLA